MARGRRSGTTADLACYGSEWPSPVNAIPRYFFHVREGRDLNRDSEGQDFPDAEAAHREAINAVREILGEKLLHRGALNHCSIEISDGAKHGHVVDVVCSRDMLLKHGRFRGYPDDILQSTPTKPPPK